jgi:hypothetical protein
MRCWVKIDLEQCLQNNLTHLVKVGASDNNRVVHVLLALEDRHKQHTAACQIFPVLASIARDPAALSPRKCPRDVRGR